MRYIRIIILLVLCLTLLLSACTRDAIVLEPATGNLENQEDIDQSSNNAQSSSTGPVEEPVIEEDTEATVTVYPQKWATGDGTVSNPWANGCIETAITNCPVGGTIFLNAGYYTLSAAVEITKQVNIIGEGMDKTIIITAAGTTNGFHSDGVDYITLKNFTMDGDAQTLGTVNQGIIALNNGNHIIFENLEIMNGGYYGIDLFQMNYSSFKNIYTNDNYSVGFYPCSNSASYGKYNTYEDIYTWNNGSIGFADRYGSGAPASTDKTHNVYDNINAWGNGTNGIMIEYTRGITLINSTAKGNGSNGDWVFGIYLLDVEDSVISNCLVLENNKRGFGIVDSNNIDVSNCFSTLNVEEGIIIGESSDGINLTNVIVKNNGTGISINGSSSNISLTSCQSYDDRETPLQDYGLEITNANTGISLSNCKFTPNQFGAIYNPAGAVITVITEKRELSLLSF